MKLECIGYQMSKYNDKWLLIQELSPSEIQLIDNKQVEELYHNSRLCDASPKNAAAKY